MDVGHIIGANATNQVNASIKELNKSTTTLSKVMIFVGILQVILIVVQIVLAFKTCKGE